MHFSEIRQSCRRLWKNRGFSIAVVLTLGLAIGATVAVFSIIDAILIAPLPYATPSQLFEVFQSKFANDEADRDTFSPADFLDLRERNHVFTDLAAYCGFHYNLTEDGNPRHLSGVAVSPSLFTILGVRPEIGRTFLPEEDSYSAPHVALLSYRLWSGQFHSDSHILGKAISLNGDPFYVVGVMPSSFQSPGYDDADVWIPLQQQIRPDRMLVRDLHYLAVVGRLRPDVKPEQARADLNRISAQLRTEFPASDNEGGAVVMPLKQALVGETRTSLILAFGIVIFVLLIAGSNVCILMLARVNGRTRELAVRTAIGASAFQILRDVIAESAILGLVSGLLALVLAIVGRVAFIHFAPYNPNVASIQINPAVMAFALVLSSVVGLGIGLLPALKFLRADIHLVLRNDGNGTTNTSGSRFLRHALITGEISLSVVLLIATALLLRSMLTLRNQPLGFRTDRISAVWVGLPRIRYQNNGDVAAFFTRVDQKLHESPGVEAVALGYPLPLQGNRFWTNFILTGKTSSVGEYEQASLRFIDSGFLPLMNIPVLVGRNFSDADDANAEPVAIISESFAHKYWSSENAVGKYITIFRDTPVRTRVVGVVGDVRSQIEDAPPPTMYVSYRQMSFPSMQVLLLSHDSSNSALIRVRQAVQSVDPQQPVEDVDSMRSIVYEALEPWRFALSLLGGLAGLAAALTGFGLFAVISYLVRERTKEIGIRMAVGASRTQVIRMIFSGTLRLVISGAFVGVGMTLLIARLTTSRLYAIHPNDPSAFLIVVLVVTMISITASLVPARRAARIEPLTALRED